MTEKTQSGGRSFQFIKNDPISAPREANRYLHDLLTAAQNSLELKASYVQNNCSDIKSMRLKVSCLKDYSKLQNKLSVVGGHSVLM